MKNKFIYLSQNGGDIFKNEDDEAMLNWTEPIYCKITHIYHIMIYNVNYSR